MKTWQEDEAGEADDSFQSRILQLRHENADQHERRSKLGEADTGHAPRADEGPSAVEVAELRDENGQLHELLDQARERLAQAERTAEQWKSREQEYESLLEEKSEVIRQLHLQMQEMQGAPSPGPSRGAPTEDELIALQEELEREREQLKQDEQALMSQMRDMEVQMSRERADLARQRSELQRLHNELKHELEIASRDAALRERLAPLYRLQEELQRRRPGSDSGLRTRAEVTIEQANGTAAPQPAAVPPPAQAEPPKAGIFRRIFSSK